MSRLSSGASGSNSAHNVGADAGALFHTASVPQGLPAVAQHPLRGVSMILPPTINGDIRSSGAGSRATAFPQFIVLSLRLMLLKRVATSIRVRGHYLFQHGSLSVPKLHSETNRASSRERPLLSYSLFVLGACGNCCSYCCCSY